MSKPDLAAIARSFGRSLPTAANAPICAPCGGVPCHSRCRDCGAHCQPGCAVNEYGRLCDECSGRAQDERIARANHGTVTRAVTLTVAPDVTLHVSAGARVTFVRGPDVLGHGRWALADASLYVGREKRGLYIDGENVTRPPSQHDAAVARSLVGLDGC